MMCTWGSFQYQDDILEIIPIRILTFNVNFLTLNMLIYLKIIKDIYSNFMSYLWFFSTEEDQIHIRSTLQGVFSVLSIPCLLMAWWLRELWHQQVWFWPRKLEYSISSIRRVKTVLWLSHLYNRIIYNWKVGLFYRQGPWISMQIQKYAWSDSRGFQPVWWADVWMIASVQ